MHPIQLNINLQMQYISISMVTNRNVPLKPFSVDMMNSCVSWIGKMVFKWLFLTHSLFMMNPYCLQRYFIFIFIYLLQLYLYTKEELFNRNLRELL